MKKFLSSLFLVVVVFASAFEACAAGPATGFDELLIHPDFSLLGGLSVSHFNNVPTSIVRSSTHLSAGTSWSFGALVGADFVRALGAEIGVFYARKKSDIDSVVGASGNLAINSVDLPVMIRYTPHPSFSLHVGGYLGIGSRAKLSATNQSTGLTSIASLSTNTDGGIIVGATTNLPIHPELDISAGAFYEYGLKDIIADLADTKTRSFQILAGVKFSPKW